MDRNQKSKRSGSFLVLLYCLGGYRSSIIYNTALKERKHDTLCTYIFYFGDKRRYLLYRSSFAGLSRIDEMMNDCVAACEFVVERGRSEAEGVYGR